MHMLNLEQEVELIANSSLDILLNRLYIKLLQDKHCAKHEILLPIYQHWFLENYKNTFKWCYYNKRTPEETSEIQTHLTNSKNNFLKIKCSCENYFDLNNYFDQFNFYIDSYEPENNEWLNGIKWFKQDIMSAILMNKE